MDRIIFYNTSLINRRKHEPSLEINQQINPSNPSIPITEPQEIQFLEKQKEIVQTEKKFNNLLNNMRSARRY
jgi:hypothetical protein